MIKPIKFNFDKDNNKDFIEHWDKKGFVIFENFFSKNECDKLIKRSLAKSGSFLYYSFVTKPNGYFFESYPL